MKLAWLWKITGGRPMKFIRNDFTDIVSGKMVKNYMDRNGKFWLAEHKWALFRVPMNGDQIMDALQNRHRPPGEMAWATLTYPSGLVTGGYIPIDGELASILHLLDDH